MLPIVPEGGHLYLQSDILHSLLKTKITDEIWSGRPIQYVRVFHQGPLIYTNGYVKIYNETDRPIGLTVILTLRIRIVPMSKV